MTRFVLAAAVGAALAAGAPQKELPVGDNRETPIAAQLAKAPLDADGKDTIKRSLDAHDYKSAETVLVKAIEADPKSPELLTLAARVFLLDHNPMNAAIALKKAEKLAPLEPLDRFNLAMAFIGIGKPAWARPELERLAAAVPDNPAFPYWLARVDYDEHKYDASIARLRAVTKAVPQFARAWDNLGLSLEATGKLDEAVAVYRRAVELNRDQKTHSPWPPLNLATLLTKRGDVAGAEPLLREAILYEPGLGEAHYRLGVNLKKQGRGRDAVAELKKATELDPNATEPLYALGQLYREQGDEAAATQAFERFRELKKKQRGS